MRKHRLAPWTQRTTALYCPKPPSAPTNKAPFPLARAVVLKKPFGASKRRIPIFKPLLACAISHTVVAVFRMMNGPTLSKGAFFASRRFLPSPEQDAELLHISASGRENGGVPFKEVDGLARLRAFIFRVINLGWRKLQTCIVIANYKKNKFVPAIRLSHGACQSAASIPTGSFCRQIMRSFTASK